MTILTEKDYCNNDTSVTLEELGFPIRRIKVKGTEKNVPILLYEAQKWLREEKDIDFAVYSGKGKDTDRIWVCNFVMEKTVHQLTHEGIVVKTFSSYEEALSEGIKEVIKILKEKIN